ncbi:MAG: hypothetical protein ACTSXA_00965 [Candidatus Heimdallarchaeota archaeon]
MSTINESQSNAETQATEEKPKDFKSRLAAAWDEAKSFETKKLKNYIGPTGIWLLIYYGISLFVMIALNIARAGWSGEAIFAAPAYFAQLFINFGLNAGKVMDKSTDVGFYNQKIVFNSTLTSASWLFAPMIIYVLGILFSILSGSGWAMPVGDYSFNLNHRYFHDYTVLLNSENKGGGFYFLLVWLPIILSILIGAIVAKHIFPDKENRGISVIKLMVYNLAVGLIVGLQMSRITGTVFIRPGLWLKAIFTNEFYGDVIEANLGYENYYTSFYNPFVIMTASWFTSFIPMFSAAIWYTVYNNNEEKVIGGIKNIPTWTKETNEKFRQRRVDRQELRIKKLSKEDQ